jgi:hypothetical protein
MRVVWSEKLTFLANLLLIGYKVCAGSCQSALVNVSGMIRTQMGTHNKSENGSSA